MNSLPGPRPGLVLMALLLTEAMGGGGGYHGELSVAPEPASKRPCLSETNTSDLRPTAQSIITHLARRSRSGEGLRLWQLPRRIQDEAEFIAFVQQAKNGDALVVDDSITDLDEARRDEAVLRDVLRQCFRDAEPVLSDPRTWTGEGGYTLLHYAASLELAEPLRLMLAVLETRGHSPDPQTTAGCTPLHAAACVGAMQCTKLLLEAGASRELRLTGPAPTHIAMLLNVFQVSGNAEEWARLHNREELAQVISRYKRRIHCHARS